MSPSAAVRALLVVAAVVTGSCRARSAPGGDGAWIAILDPPPGAQLAITTSHPELPISFAVSEVAFDRPEECRGAACAHVHLYVDGPSCSVSTVAQPYAGLRIPMTADLRSCVAAGGPVTVTLELHGPDHRPFHDSSGASVSDTVTIDLRVEATGKPTDSVRRPPDPDDDDDGCGCSGDGDDDEDEGEDEEETSTA